MSGSDDHSSTVADEAVRLADALAALAGGTSDRSDESASARQDRPGAADPGTAGRGGTTSEDATEPGCACGTPSVQAVCEICPVCRVAAFLAEVRPETVERVADVLSMVVGSLEAFAAQRRSEMAGSEPSGQSTESTAGEAGEWQSVDVEGEDEDA